MTLRNLILVTALLALWPALPARAIDWLTAPSYYTHDRVTAERVAQFSPIGPFYYYSRPDYLKSGYRHYRSTIQAGGSADNLHIVEEWGRPVRPYGEWRFPYRPYSVPYSQWGPPFGGLGPGGTYAPGGYGLYGGFGLGGGYGPGGYGPDAYAPQGQFHGGPLHQPPAANYAQPWLDGHHPEYNQQDRSPYYRPYSVPAP